MATWSFKLNANDVFQDIYQNFIDLYNQGQTPAEISKQIQDDFEAMFKDFDDRNNCLFALAMAQWETKSLDPIIYNQVKEIIEKQQDLDIWKGLGADEKTLEKRKTELRNFLSQISKEKDKAKRRIKPKYEFIQVDIISLMAPDNKKIFTVSEFFTNGLYQETGSLMMWQPGVDKILVNGGGCSVLYFRGQDKKISAKWLDSQILEVSYDKEIVFYQERGASLFLWR